MYILHRGNADDETDREDLDSLSIFNTDIGMMLVRRVKAKQNPDYWLEIIWWCNDQYQRRADTDVVDHCYAEADAADNRCDDEKTM